MAIYVKMGNIEGNVTAKGYEKHIEFLTAGFGNTRHVSMSVGSGKEREVDRPQLQEIALVKEADRATPYLFHEACAGKAIDKVEINFVKTSNDATETYMQYVLSNVLVSGYSAAGGSDSDPTEQIILAYTKFELKYHPRKKDNTLDSAIPAGYDLDQAKKI